MINSRCFCWYACLSVYVCVCVCLSVCLPFRLSDWLSVTLPSKFALLYFVWFWQVSTKDIFAGMMKTQTITTTIGGRCLMVNTLTTRWSTTAAAQTDTLQTPSSYQQTRPSCSSSRTPMSVSMSRECAWARNSSRGTLRTGPSLETRNGAPFRTERSERISNLIIVIIQDIKSYQFAWLDVAVAWMVNKNGREMIYLYYVYLFNFYREIRTELYKAVNEVNLCINKWHTSLEDI